MKLKLLIILTLGVLAGAACDPASNTNTSANNRNTNRSASPTAMPSPSPDDAVWSNSNVSREDYDKNRAEYERKKGTSTIGQGANDSWLWFKTKAELASIDDLRDSTINVDVENDVITLRGTVGTASQITAAEKAAKSIEGQKGVKNELKIRANDSVTNQMVNGNTSNSNKK